MLICSWLKFCIEFYWTVPHLMYILLSRVRCGSHIFSLKFKPTSRLNSTARLIFFVWPVTVYLENKIYMYIYELACLEECIEQSHSTVPYCIFSLACRYLLWLRVRMGEIQHDASARNTTNFNRASKIYTYDSDAHARINKTACKLWQYQSYNSGFHFSVEK